MNIENSHKIIKELINLHSIDGVIDVYINGGEYESANCITVKFAHFSARGFSDLLHELENLSFYDCIDNEQPVHSSFKLDDEMEMIVGSLNYNITPD